MNFKKAIVPVSGLGALLAAGQAAAVDTVPILAELNTAQTSVETIGAAVLMIAVVVAVFKYVRKAL